jgi:hypothetical protein
MAATLFSLAQMMKVKPNLDLNRGGNLKAKVIFNCSPGYV